MEIRSRGPLVIACTKRFLGCENARSSSLRIRASCYFTPRHREALVNLEFGIESRKGVVVLIGEAGMGKTTVTRAVIEKQHGRDMKCVYLYNPAHTRAEFLEFLARAFELSKAAERSKSRLMAELASRLTALREEDKTVALLIDEAQSLSDELLEELRMLTNIETYNEKLLTLVLIGQPQLAERLNDERLGQLKQRVELRCTLTPFDLPETSAYIWSSDPDGRWRWGETVYRDAIAVIHERSRGIPRSISVICENALVSAYADNQRSVTRRLVEEVCDELDLRGRPPAASVADMPVTVSAPTSDDSLRDGDRLEPTPPRRKLSQRLCARRFPLDSRPDGTSLVVVFVGRLALMNRIDRALKRRAKRRAKSPRMNPAAGPATAATGRGVSTDSRGAARSLSIEEHHADSMRKLPPVGVAGSHELLESPSDLASAPRATEEVFRKFNATIRGKVIGGAQMDRRPAEEYRRLAATLHQVQMERGIKKVMVTSAMAGEGKTLTALNLALTLSESPIIGGSCSSTPTFGARASMSCSTLPMSLA